MEFKLTEEQAFIAESAREFLAHVSNSDAIRAHMELPKGYDDQVWQQISQDMGWTAILVPEEFGGLGLGWVELSLVLEAMGQHLLCAPYLASSCMATTALLVGGNQEQKSLYLPLLASGEIKGTLAIAPPHGDFESGGMTVEYSPSGDDFIITGQSGFVLNGHGAQLVIVAARRAGSSDSKDVSLFLVPSETPGLTIKPRPTLDQTRPLADIEWDQVKVQRKNLLGQEVQTFQDLEVILSLAAIGVAAEQLGGCQEVLDQSVTYSMERQQFGKPIAGFQAIKHKAADMMLRAEASRSAVYYASCIADDFMTQQISDASELKEAASIAKSYCSEAFFHNASEALQIHGGVGFTWEYDIHLYLKRARSMSSFLGDPDYHREKIASRLLEESTI